MFFVVLSIFILALSPILYGTTVPFHKWWRSLDRLLAFLVGIIVVAHMLPHAWQAAGWAAVGFVLLGMLVPSMMERLFRHASARIHTASLVIGFFGLAVHGLSDGAAFSQSFKPDFGWMISAVLLHRLPEGLLICSLFQKQRGFLHPWVLIGFLSFSTVLGYYLGQHVFRAIHNLYLGYFQALISGSLLHAVVDFHPPSSSHPHDHTPDYTHDQHPT